MDHLISLFERYEIAFRLDSNQLLFPSLLKETRPAQVCATPSLLGFAEFPLSDFLPRTTSTRPALRLTHRASWSATSSSTSCLRASFRACSSASSCSAGSPPSSGGTASSSARRRYCYLQPMLIPSENTRSRARTHTHIHAYSCCRVVDPILLSPKILSFYAMDTFYISSILFACLSRISFEFMHMSAASFLTGRFQCCLYIEAEPKDALLKICIRGFGVHRTLLFISDGNSRSMRGVRCPNDWFSRNFPARPRVAQAEAGCVRALHLRLAPLQHQGPRGGRSGTLIHTFLPRARTHTLTIPLTPPASSRTRPIRSILRRRTKRRSSARRIGS
jgi:hypothetical protein